MNMIREINDNEIKQCVSVIRQSFKTVADEFGFTEENAPLFTAFATDEAKVLMWKSEQHRPMFGYFEDNELVGYYNLALTPEGDCEIGSLCVLPDKRHLGIGDALLADAVSRAKAAGFGKIKLSIVEENKVLRKWYEDHGFVHVGTKKFDFFPFTCGYLEKSLSN